MLRARPLFVTAIILLTVAACGDRPPFKKTDAEIGNGIFQDEKLSKDDQATVYEQIAYSNFSVKNHQLYFESMRSNGEMEAPVLVGTLSKGKGQSFELTPNSALGGIASSEQNAPLAALLKWIDGKNLKVFMQGKTLTLKNAANDTRHFTFTPDETATGVRTKISQKINERASLQKQFVESTTGVTFVLARQVITKQDIAPKSTSTSLGGEDLDLTDLPADSLRGPQSLNDDDQDLGPGDTVSSPATTNTRFQRTRPKPPPKPKPVTKTVDAKDIPAEEKLGNGLLAINIKKLSFKEKNGTVVAVVNDKYEAKVSFFLMKDRFAEQVTTADKKIISKKLALVMEIQGLDPKVYNIAETNARTYGTIVDLSDDKILKLVSHDQKDRTLGVSQEFTIVASTDPAATAPVTATPVKPTEETSKPATPPAPAATPAPATPAAEPKTPSPTEPAAPAPTAMPKPS